LVISIYPITGIGEIREGVRLGEAIAEALVKNSLTILKGDIIAVTSKAVSKAEGRLVKLNGIRPSPKAVKLARSLNKDPRIVELILKESRMVLRVERGIIITRTKLGIVCANAGVDQSNVPEGYAALLPKDPDRSAEKIAEQIEARTGVKPAVIITDTYGRPWRRGQVQFAIGVYGLNPILDYRGKPDTFGKVLKVTEIAVADELASAAELVMGKTKMCPAALIRGYEYEVGFVGAKYLIRPLKEDLFK
jgi:coenzyme F420-0:L-glutamate ligase/coenzyme F420-1:gamma-L-glutamate ligase